MIVYTTHMQVALFLLTAQGVIWFLHYVVYKTFAVFFLPHTWMRVIWGILIFLLSLCFLGFTLLARSEYFTTMPWIGSAYKVSAIWMSFASYIFLSCLISSILYIVADWIIPGASKALAITVLIIFSIASVYFQVKGLSDARNIETTRYTTLLANLPEYWVGKEVALVADTHLGIVKTVDDLSKVVDKIMDEKPEMILIAGDLYDGLPVDMGEVSLVLERLRAPSGVYFVGGNHEEYGPKLGYLDSISRAGITILDDEILEVNGIQLIGLSYPTSLDAPSTQSILSRMQIKKNTPSILLKHVPKDIEPIAEAGISLALFGHSHNGQQFPWNLLADYVYKGFAYGKNRMNGTITITTSGAGTWGPPSRIGTSNEVVIINLQDNN